MRHAALLVLCAGLLVGCQSTRYDRGDRSYPASARVDSRGGQDRYQVCHKGRRTLTLPEPAVRAHLDHGDRLGDCSRRGRRDGERGRGRGRGNGRNG